jgi:hypothetical protein
VLTRATSACIVRKSASSMWRPDVWIYRTARSKCIVMVTTGSPIPVATRSPEWYHYSYHFQED